MSRALLFLCAALIVASCGIQRPLVRPADIPAYEKKRQEKLERRRIEPEEIPQVMSQHRGVA